jgi:hypothetical protein
LAGFMASVVAGVLGFVACLLWIVVCFLDYHTTDIPSNEYRIHGPGTTRRGNNIYVFDEDYHIGY